jgi:hypothetical protein
MAAKKNYHKPPEDPRTIGGGLKAQGRARREKLQLMINGRPRHARNDLLPEMRLQTLAIADLTMPKHLVRKLDPGHIKEVANGIQPIGFSVPVLVGKGTTLSTSNAISRQLNHTVCYAPRRPEVTKRLSRPIAPPTFGRGRIMKEFRRIYDQVSNCYRPCHADYTQKHN